MYVRVSVISLFLYSFSENDAIVGFQSDTPAAVIFQVTKLMPKDHDLTEYAYEIERKSKYLLLQMATPDALIRLKHSGLARLEQQELWETYFKNQKHDSLTDFMKNVLLSANDNVFVQVSQTEILILSLLYHIDIILCQQCIV